MGAFNNTGKILKLAAWLILILNAGRVTAQLTAINTFFDKEFYRGRDLFEKEKYTAAQEVFREYIENREPDEYELVQEASFLHALCAMRLLNNDAEYLMISYISEYPLSRNIERAYFEMGRYACEKKRYANAPLFHL